MLSAVQSVKAANADAKCDYFERDYAMEGDYAVVEDGIEKILNGEKTNNAETVDLTRFACINGDKTLGSNVLRTKLRYTFCGDSILSETFSTKTGIRRDMISKGDSLWLTGIETRNSHFVADAPLLLTASQAIDFQGHLRRHQSEYYRVNGALSTISYPLNGVIIAPGDTLQDTWVHCVNITAELTPTDSKYSPTGQNTFPSKCNIAYIYSAENDYPVAILSTANFGESQTLQPQTTFAIFYSHDPVESAKENRQIKNKPPKPTFAIGVNDISINVTNADSNAHIFISGSASPDAILIISDESGRVIDTRKVNDRSQIKIYNLHPGYYIAALSDCGRIASQSFYIK